MLDHDTLTWKFRSEPDPGTNGRAYAPRPASVKVGSHFDILAKNGQKLHQTTDRNRSGRRRIQGGYLRLCGTEEFGRLGLG
jgi:hypothetical protein